MDLERLLDGDSRTSYTCSGPDKSCSESMDLETQNAESTTGSSKDCTTSGNATKTKAAALDERSSSRQVSSASNLLKPPHNAPLSSAGARPDRPISPLPSNRPRPQSAPSTFHTTSLFLSLTKTLEAIRREAGNDDRRQLESLQAMSVAFEGGSIRVARLNSRQDAEWQAYKGFCASLKVPPFPITPVKACLAIARYVSLPVSPELRRLSGVKDTWTAPSRVEGALATLGDISRRTAGLWPKASNYVEPPDRYVLFIELIEDARRLMRLKPPPLPTEPTRYVARPDGATQRRGAAGPPSTSKLSNGAVSVHLKSRATQSDLKMYHINVGSKVIYKYLLRDFRALIDDFSHQPPEDPDNIRRAEIFLDQALLLVDKREASRLKEISILYLHVASLIPFSPLPITPLRQAIFAIAYSPGALHAALIDGAPGAQNYVTRRRYPRLRPDELRPALEDLEKLQKLSTGGCASRRSDDAQWAEWKTGILADLVKRPSSSGLPAPAPPPPSSSVRPLPFTAITPSRPLLGKPSQPVAYRPYDLKPSSDAMEDSQGTRLPAVKRRTTQSDDGSQGARTESTAPESALSPSPSVSPPPKRKKLPKGWVYRSPSPHPIFVPERKGDLPMSRRPPPLPIVLPSPRCWLASEDAQARSVGVNRPRRKRNHLPHMIELEYDDESGSEDAADASATGNDDDA